MKKIISILFLLMLSYGCIEDTLTTEYATGGQIGVSEEALEALANSTMAYMYAYNYFSSDAEQQQFGYPAMMIIRDALTDCPYGTSNYNHFNTPWCNLSTLTSIDRSRQPWKYYYQMILNANNLIVSVEDPDESKAGIQHAYGNALVYRAMAYMDLMRMYEYKRTGVAALDNEADKNEIWGLTTVIVDELFDDTNAKNNPRAPFYKMYRFIMNDLNRAEKYLESYTRPGKNRADLSVVQAYKARLWLEIATRFTKYPEDLATMLSHDDEEELAVYPKLGVSSASECYQKAAEYARKVINNGKYAPLTEGEWHSLTDGFNNAKVNSWIFAVMITSPDMVYSRTNSFLSNCVTEFSRGYSRKDYKSYRMIDKRLYDRVEDADWRKVTWIDPADAKKIPTPEKYHTLFKMDGSDEEWSDRLAYTGFKYRPNNGDISDDYKHALQTDFPIIRVEEMYFIEAEALAYTQGLQAGVNALKSFLNTYRYTDGSYDPEVSNVDDFVDSHLVIQKRIEFWGEGLAFFDIKRRELAITRGYTGSNWIETIRFNSRPGYTPSWLNLYVPYEGEGSINHAIKLNPNPLVATSYGLWPNSNF